MRLFYITVFVPASVCIPIVAGWLRYKVLPAYARVIFWYLLMAGVVNVAASFMASRRVNNLPLLHVYTATEFIFLSIFYRKIFGGRISIALNWAIIIFLLLCTANAFLFGSIYEYNIIPRTLETVTLGALSIVFFFMDKKHNETALWLNAGVLLYFSGSFFLFLFFEVLAKDRSVNNLAWILHATLVLLMYLLFATGFLRSEKK